MQLQGGGVNLQGGTGINLGNVNPVNATGISSPAPAPTQTTNTSTNNNTGTTGSTGFTGLAGTTLNAPAYIAGIQQEYGSQLAAAPTTANEYQQALNTAIGGYTGGAAAQGAQQQAQANSQLGQIGTQENVTRAQQNLSLSELAAQIRAQNQGLGAQLGAVGAGSSSAVDMGERGLAQEQNTNRANIQQQAAGNISNLESQKTGVNAVLAANLAAIDQWKQTQIATVQANYAQLMTNLNTAVETAQGEEKARLAEFGQSLTGSALQSLSNINNITSSAVGNLMSQNTAAQPNLTNVPQAQAVNPISVGTISPFQITPQANTGNATANPTGGSLSALLQQQQNNQTA